MDSTKAGQRRNLHTSRMPLDLSSPAVLVRHRAGQLKTLSQFAGPMEQAPRSPNETVSSESGCLQTDYETKSFSSSGGLPNMTSRFLVPWCFAVVFATSSACSQTQTDLLVFRGLATVTALQKSNAGLAALSADYTLTHDIETGNLAQPSLLPFAEQEQQALRDAFITSKNLADLSDGLGTTLGAAYVARFHYIDHTSVSPMPEPLKRHRSPCLPRSSPNNSLLCPVRFEQSAQLPAAGTSCASRLLNGASFKTNRILLSIQNCKFRTGRRMRAVLIRRC